TGDGTERSVALRMARQPALTRDEPPLLWTVLDEAALRRRVGGAELRRAPPAGAGGGRAYGGPAGAGAGAAQPAERGAAGDPVRRGRAPGHGAAVRDPGLSRAGRPGRGLPGG